MDNPITALLAYKLSFKFLVFFFFRFCVCLVIAYLVKILKKITENTINKSKS